MESSGGLEDFRAASPLLQRVLDECGEGLSDSAVKIAERIGPFSSHDTWNMSVDMFTSVSGGQQVIDLAKVVVQARELAPKLPGEVRDASADPAEVVMEKIFKEKIPKLKPYELGAVPSAVSGVVSGNWTKSLCAA